MDKFSDERTKEVHETRFAKGIPQHVSVAAHEIIQLLLAAASLQDVGVLGPILRWSNLPGRYGVVVDAKWHVTFKWSGGAAWELKLERR